MEKPEVSLVDLAAETDISEVVALDEAFRRLEGESPDVAEVVRLRFYAGLTIEETAAAMELSTATVKRHWTAARAWLTRELLSSGTGRD